MDFANRIKGMGGVRVGVLGVRLRKEALIRRNNALFRFVFFGLGRAKQPADRNSQKNTEKLGGIPNPKKNKAKKCIVSSY